jgi:hypothetical protein
MRLWAIVSHHLCISTILIARSYACDEPDAGCALIGLVELKIKTSLAATMVRWCEGGMNQGLLPMTISEGKEFILCMPFIELR